MLRYRQQRAIRLISMVDGSVIAVTDSITELRENTSSVASRREPTWVWGEGRFFALLGSQTLRVYDLREKRRIELNNRIPMELAGSSWVSLTINGDIVATRYGGLDTMESQTLGTQWRYAVRSVDGHLYTKPSGSNTDVLWVGPTSGGDIATRRFEVPTRALERGIRYAWSRGRFLGIADSIGGFAVIDEGGTPLFRTAPIAGQQTPRLAVSLADGVLVTRPTRDALIPETLVRIDGTSVQQTDASAFIPEGSVLIQPQQLYAGPILSFTARHATMLVDYQAQEVVGYVGPGVPVGVSARGAVVGDSDGRYRYWRIP